MFTIAFFVLTLLFVGNFVVPSDAQVPPNPLFHSQDAINSYHNYYEDMKTEVRGHMSRYMTDISGEILGIFTGVMDTWRRQNGGASAALRMLVQPKSTPEIGETIRSCTEDIATRLLHLQNDVFEGLEDWHDYITNLQTSVVRKLVDFDIVRRYDYFIDEFNPVITEAHNRFQFEFVPSLETRLRNLCDAQPVLSQDFSQCISTILKKH